MGFALKGFFWLVRRCSLMRVDETVLKKSSGRTVACVAKGRTVDVYHPEIVLGHTLGI